MSRPTSQTSTVTTTATNVVSRSLSVKTTTKTGRNNLLPPSDIKLFVTNLRLLDLDLRNDWPGITVQTFSARNADQKQRIGAAEWSLFRLFEIWDPVETSQKLQPFFPPLEPLQSRNLRIALHRSLDSLKKEGVLGRESVLRKTMLDECKGDKFYEILVLFSTAVLKKVLASKPTDKRRIAVARKLATASALPNSTQDSLLPLAIAHKASLVNVLKKKEQKRRRFAEFEELLDTKADGINQRIRKCKETPRAQKPPIPQRESDAIKKQLRDNWIGNQKWLDVMLHGDDVQAEDAFLNSSFTQVWRTVEQGRKLEDAVPDIGLMENLQLRVQEQQFRLQKWKTFHASLQEGGSAPEVTHKKVVAATKDFKFDDHLQLQLRPKIPDDEPIRKISLHPELADILSEMDEELSRVAAAKHNRSSILQPRRRGSSLGNSRSPARRKKSRSDSAPKVPPVSPPRHTRPAPTVRKPSKETIPTRHAQPRIPTTATPMDSEATLVGLPSTVDNAMPTHEQQYSTEAAEQTSDPLPTITSPSQPRRPIAPPSPSPSPPPPSSYFPSEPPVFDPPTLPAEEALAAQIISTIGDATPSPVKKLQPRLNLAERTRMSMAHTHSFPPITESPALPSPPLPEQSPAFDTATHLGLERQQSLLERTRMSMAAMSSKPRASLAPPQKDKRKSSRLSNFPVNQFDTPRTRRSFEAIEEAKSGEKTPKEDLFSDEVDYDRVFKSRPRIATSPVFGTPAGVNGMEDDEEFDEDVTGVDLADVDNEEDGDITVAWENSPLRGARKSRMLS
ncbi:hypothetical protein CC80DRAFT_590093 [Byssothecium circinans]|uniref:HAUS augmin-like complex subunit 6 N-terminal domain-containing protein n=1 Tax=Byssothecium circinans TaxID=147558 RepID=A0A6A5UA78_9PLEO|nr:hypothetical protein CC80DRAFT_590093 [Byssothecium circinans]